MGQEVRPLYVSSMFRVQGCKLAGCLLLLLLTQSPVTVPTLCCLVAVAQEVLQRQGAICGEASDASRAHSFLGRSRTSTHL